MVFVAETDCRANGKNQYILLYLISNGKGKFTSDMSLSTFRQEIKSGQFAETIYRGNQADSGPRLSRQNPDWARIQRQPITEDLVNIVRPAHKITVPDWIDLLPWQISNLLHSN